MTLSSAALDAADSNNNHNTKAETALRCARGRSHPQWSIAMSSLIRTVLLVLLAAVPPAHAATVGAIQTNYSANLSAEPFSKTTTVPGIGDPGLAFLDRLAFTLDAPGEVTLEAEAVNVQALALLLPAGLAFILEDADRLVGRGFLNAGSHVAELSGEVIGRTDGTYTFSALVAAIPEPHTWMLMLAGLVAFGAVVVRRR